MGREIKRVELDFNWPVGAVWKGFINPFRSQDCKACAGSGYNQETKELSDSWYNLGGPRYSGWSHHLEQSEVDALIEHGRLMDFTHTFVSDEGWKKRDPMPIITAAEVNAWSLKGFGHDAINKWICVEARARRLGVWAECELCHGEGQIWFSDEIKKLSEDWKPEEPPTGKGWQLWETVSEGSPISPVFENKESLSDWMVNHEGYSRKASDAFLNEGWAPSFIGIPGKGLVSGVEACAE